MDYSHRCLYEYARVEDRGLVLRETFNFLVFQKIHALHPNPAYGTNALRRA
jgi:hypothetical protein